MPNLGAATVWAVPAQETETWVTCSLAVSSFLDCSRYLNYRGSELADRRFLRSCARRTSSFHVCQEASTMKVGRFTTRLAYLMLAVVFMSVGSWRALAQAG